MPKEINVLRDALAAPDKGSLSRHRDAILELRRKGYSWREIAEFLCHRGVTTDHSKVFRFITKTKATGGVMTASPDHKASSALIDVVYDSQMPQIRQLGTDESQRAAAMMASASVAKRLATEVLKVTAPWVDDDEDHDLSYVTNSFYTCSLNLKRPFYIQADPFGLYLRDASPVLWFWLEVTPKRLLRALEEGDIPGDYCYFDNGDWNWVLVRTAELSVEKMKGLLDQGYGSGDELPHIASNIRIAGRDLESLKKEIADTATRFGKFKV